MSTIEQEEKLNLQKNLLQYGGYNKVSIEPDDNEFEVRIDYQKELEMALEEYNGYLKILIVLNSQMDQLLLNFNEKVFDKINEELKTIKVKINLLNEKVKIISDDLKNSITTNIQKIFKEIKEIFDEIKDKIILMAYKVRKIKIHRQKENTSDDRPKLYCNQDQDELEKFYKITFANSNAKKDINITDSDYVFEDEKDFLCEEPLRKIEQSAKRRHPENDSIVQVSKEIQSLTNQIKMEMNDHSENSQGEALLPPSSESSEQKYKCPRNQRASLKCNSPRVVVVGGVEDSKNQSDNNFESSESFDYNLIGPEDRLQKRRVPTMKCILVWIVSSLAALALLVGLKYTFYNSLFSQRK